MRCPRGLGWGFLFIAGYIIFLPSFPIGLHLAFHSIPPSICQRIILDGNPSRCPPSAPPLRWRWLGVWFWGLNWLGLGTCLLVLKLCGDGMSTSLYAPSHCIGCPLSVVVLVGIEFFVGIVCNSQALSCFISSWLVWDNIILFWTFVYVSCLESTLSWREVFRAA